MLHCSEPTTALIGSVNLSLAVPAYDALEAAGGFPLRTAALRRIERIIARAVAARSPSAKLPERVEYVSKAAAKASAASLLLGAFRFDLDPGFDWKGLQETLESYSLGYVEPWNASTHGLTHATA